MGGIPWMVCHASCANFKLYHGIVVSGLDHYHTPFFFPYLGRADLLLKLMFLVVLLFR